MNGVRFYLEHKSASDKRKGIHSGNVFAAFVCNGVNSTGGYDGVGAVFNDPNSPCAGTGCGRYWLRTLCKRISETKAREIHPELFRYLDMES